jgi:N-acyl-D-amino-acid deacylase
VIREGFFADVFTFDPDAFTDRATLDAPRRPASGVQDVIVNGQPALRGGVPTGLTPGKALFRQPLGAAAPGMTVAYG